MSSISAAVIVLSASLFTASLIKMLAPTGRTEKIMRLVISVFVVICIVTSIKSVLDNIKIKGITNTSYSMPDNSQTDSKVLKVTGDYLVEYTEKLLNSQNINAKKIKITVDSDTNDVINVTKLCIYLDNDDAHVKKQVEDLIEKDFNFTPDIIFED